MKPNFQPTARVVARSRSSVSGVDIITIELEYWKSIHGEFMTHRVFSRNASSSRAIPVKRLLLEAMERPSGPLVWTSEKKGMSGGAEIFDVEGALFTWNMAGHRAVGYAQELVNRNIHKSIANRLIEPFTAIRVLVTSTDWLNFFGLRLHKDAQPEMRILANAMWNAIKNGHKATLLKPGEWHLPYADDMLTREECEEYCFDHDTKTFNPDSVNKVLKMVSIARCARVSYSRPGTTTRSTINEDIDLYDRLLSSKPLHASPAEHLATPDEYGAGPGASRSEWGNFFTWKQFRKGLLGEDEAPLPEGYNAEELGLTR